MITEDDKKVEDVIARLDGKIILKCMSCESTGACPGNCTQFFCSAECYRSWQAKHT